MPDFPPDRGHADFQPDRELNDENVERSSVERAVELLNAAWAIANYDEDLELDDAARSERVRHYLLGGCHDLVALAASDPGELAELMEATARLRPRAAQMACTLLAAEIARQGVRFGVSTTGEEAA